MDLDPHHWIGVFKLMIPVAIVFWLEFGSDISNWLKAKCNQLLGHDPDDLPLAD